MNAPSPQVTKALEQLSVIAPFAGNAELIRKRVEEISPALSAANSEKLKEITENLQRGSGALAAKGVLSPEAEAALERLSGLIALGAVQRLADATRPRRFHEIHKAASAAAPLAAPSPSAPILPSPSEISRSPVTSSQPVRRRRQRPVADPPRSRRLVEPPRQLPERVGEEVAARQARSRRETAIALLILAGLEEEREHLEALEERLSAGTKPAQYHAALSARIVLKGLADHCFPARPGCWRDRCGGEHKVGEINVSNRLAAFVDQKLPDLSSEEHCLFIATLDTVFRWTGRGPHQIYRQGEGGEFYLRFLEVLSVIARAYSPRAC